MQFNPPASLASHPNVVQPSPYLSSGAQSSSSSMDASVQSNIASRQVTSATLPKQKQYSFLTGLANFHISRGHPLPPGLTGVPYPSGYDPTNSPWKNVECTQGEIGSFRLGAKDIKLPHLWTIVLQAGGGLKVTQQNAWNQIIRHFDLPELLPGHPSTGQRSSAHVLANYYNVILHPFEEVWRRNVQENNRKAMMSAGRPPGSSVGMSNNSSSVLHPPGTILHGAASQIGAPSVNNMTGLMNQSVSGNQNPSCGSPPAPPSQPSPQSPHPPHITSGPNISASFGFSESLASHTLPQSLAMASPLSATNDQHDQELPAVKRRLETEEADNKRAKLKTETDVPDSLASVTSSADQPLASTASAPTTPSSAPRPRSRMRTKVEYIPLVREVDTHGGRDLNLLEEEYLRAQRRPMRDINEWGTVDIEAITMSVRSRLTVELSYALTTLTLLSTMRGPTPGSGFPIAQCADLLEEVLDLLEDEAFGGVADVQQHRLAEDTRIPRHRELVVILHDAESFPFARLGESQPLNQNEQGPWHRPGNLVLAVINIIRNLSVIPDNLPFLAKHERMLELVLRTSSITLPADNGPPRPASPSLTLSAVLQVRKDALHILSNLASVISFSPILPPSDSTVRIITRIFEVVASVLVEPTDAVPPTRLVGVPPTVCRPPSLPDIALDVFTRIAHLDHNRKMFSRIIPQKWMWRLLETLVHRLPVSDSDFIVLSREPWASYLEKATMAIYVIAFLSPPELKKQIRSDKALRFSQVMLRLVQRFLTTSSTPEARTWLMDTARRAIEALKAIDDGDDAFDTSQSTQPTLAFGMGFGETGETTVEGGTGMLASRRDVAWDLLMQRDLDPVLFAQLDSLMRVDS